MDTLKEARALLRLQALPGVADRSVDRLVRAFGSGVEALNAPFDDFAEVVGVGPARARRAPVPPTDPVDRALERAGRGEFRVVVRTGADYPGSLLHLADPPPVLFLRGDPALLDRPTVAVVGSRRSTGYGRRVAGDVARVLARRGVVLASGLALGIDGAAHRASLDAGGATLAVLGTGIDVAHPRSNAGLFRRIARDGLLVSEFLPGTPALPPHFPRRNRILAALAWEVVVVEAAKRSGAINTAHQALDLGRRVLAVPGSIYARQSEGTNRLQKDGAGPLVSPEAVLEDQPGLDLPGGSASRRVPSRLPPDARALWAALSPEPARVDDLARRAGVPTGRALAALSTLELDGWVSRAPGMRFLRTSA